VGVREYKGFLIPYIILLDAQFNNGRWIYWLECLRDRHIPDNGLPQIEFCDSSAYGPSKEVHRHIEKCIEYLSYKTGAWNALSLLLAWILFGLGKADYPKDISEDQHEWLYRNFNAGLLIRAPYDYWGDIICEKHSNGWNPNGFYPTPHSICKMMTQMIMGDTNQHKGIFSTVSDPAVGTGRMLLEASNRSIFLYGQDIDHMVLKACHINMILYAPWAAMPVESIEEPPYYRIPEKASIAAEAALLLVSQLNEEIGGRQNIVPIKEKKKEAA
jgi:hypothetical protein